MSTSPRQPSRLGVFGGSFDPPHLGHLIMAEAACEQLSLDLVLFVPVAVQPLKQGRPVTSPAHRAEMLRLAIEENPCFDLSTVEIDRPPPSYTVDTLEHLAQQYPGSLLWFILGADALSTLARWRDPAGILSRARLAAVRRPGTAVDLTSVGTSLAGLAEAVDWVDAPLIDISATDLRLRSMEGRSLRYRVPEAVREYIEANGLYHPVSI